jgi:hypothetical protein
VVNCERRELLIVDGCRAQERRSPEALASLVPSGALACKEGVDRYREVCNNGTPSQELRALEL